MSSEAKQSAKSGEQYQDGRRLATLLANSPIGLALAAPDGSIVEVNAALCRMLGRDEASLTASTWQDLTYPDDLDVDLHLFGEVLAGKRDGYQLTKRFVKQDGAVVWGTLSLSCVRGRKGHVQYFIAQIVDVSELVELRESAKDSEDRFRMLAENSSSFVVLTDKAGVVEWISDSVEGVLGWSPSSVVGRASADFVDPNALAEMEILHARADAGEDASGRIQIRSNAGEFRWFLRTLRPVFDDHGTQVGRVMGYHDIQAEVEAEIRLAESEQNYRLLAENASDIVFRGTPDRVFTWVSPSVAEVLGWDPKEMVGCHVEDFLHPDDLEIVIQASLALNDNRRSEYEARWRQSNGDYRWLAVIAHATHDPSGAVTGRVAGARDITAEHEARRAMALSEQRFRLAMESAPVGMAVVDLDRRFLEVNPALCRMIGHDQPWFLEHRVPDLLDPEDDLVDLQARAEVLTGPTRTAVRTKRLIAADGSRIITDHSIGLLHDEDGRPTSFVSLFVDVTQAYQAQERLAFLASHDPLTQADNRAELLTHLQRALTLQPRTGNNVAVLFMDLDGLKEVNDSLGHAVGDRLIVRLAEVIRSQLRQDDHVARIGGDEFVAALMGVHGVGDAEAVAAKIHTALEVPFEIDGHTVTSTVSIGVAVAEPGDDVDRLIARADMSMYTAKQAGRAATAVGPVS